MANNIRDTMPQPKTTVDLDIPTTAAERVQRQDVEFEKRENEYTFQEYLERSDAKGVIDFSLRILRTPEGLLYFYIHPANLDGETGGFSVSGGFVCKIHDNLAAGSSRSVIRLVGSGT